MDGIARHEAYACGFSHLLEKECVMIMDIRGK